ncbi:Helix-turn-helix domain-containing protein [Soonwooa buanensis]|uniref:Helix-turn-helix domain-containing protein n=1 Tax=Soonwooa buanensis TaxID=619805 RepID=A0A1T5GR79_9FLAO|nr:helix-turn-helix transcriptional regulator [Soonwooa buanensis]SKC10858.1 Helix-turn-helix domain-containing protein [Soonwooa buanensis]
MDYSKIKFLICLFLTTFCFGQQKLDEGKSKNFAYYKNLVNTSSHNYYHNSEALLQNAQTNYEKVYANLIMGGAKYSTGFYTQAVYYYEVAEKMGKNIDSINLKMAYTNGLAMSYRRAGLIEQSDDAWQNYIKLQNKSKNPYKEAQYYYDLSKIYDIDAKYCKASEARNKYLDLVPTDIQKKDLDYIFAIYAQNAFTQMKCGNVIEAEQNLKKADASISDVVVRENSSLYEIYDLAKALLSLKKGNKDEAKEFFSSAYSRSKAKNTVAATKLILKERLHAKIDSPEEQLAFAEEVDDITNNETLRIQELTKYETKKSKTKIQEEKTKTRIVFLLVVFCIICLIILVWYNRLKRKKLTAAFQEIIAGLEQKKNTKIESHASTSDDIREIENEEQIILQLKNLEQKNFFLKQNLLATQLATKLNITPRNLSFLLKKYYNQDFNNYMNDLRIDYFTQLLKDNPQYRKYKIAALAEMCGYNSYNQFAVNFKAKTKISPSQYLTYLEKDFEK